MAQNNLEVGMRCIKYMLLCVTAMFVLTSALIISVGTTIYAIYYDVSFFLDSQLFSPATFIIVIGVIMLFVSLFGCIGALKESTCLVNIFAVVLSLVLVLEISAAIAAYVLRAQVADMLDQNLRETLPSYYTNPEVEDGFDFIQSRLNCCGVDSYLDWGDVPSDGHSGIAVSNITVPYSCCAQTRYEIVGETEVQECLKLYANGCLPRITYLIYQSAGLIGAGAMTIAFIQIIGIVFSFSLASAIRKAKNERERRRWEIQERMINAYTSLNPEKEQKPVVYVPFQGQATA
ncbi:CD63 antigen-like [Maniola jurtina]|uniref:CD63 antigen-like n=1 Tax=Maniola jurtina TaxID=191418 RepID=UPI001E687EEB|nr:CD63 antigen-like [Maniola jurtina]XP_045784359.1 CD63 antigen-like [Maniola jurtina]